MPKYTSYILYLLLSVLVVLLYMNDFGPLTNLQRTVDDMLCEFTAPEGTRPNVAIVTIDGRSFDEYGNWPWNRDLIGDLSAAVASGEPKTIVLDFELTENAYQDSAGYTEILSEQFSWIKNYVLPYDIALATYRTEKTNNPPYLFDYSLSIDNPLGLMSENSSLTVRKIFLPADKLMADKPAIGFNYQMPDHDRILRHQSLTMNYEGYYYPSVSLLASANYLDIPTSKITVTEGENIQLGSSRTIPIDDNSRIFINYPNDLQFSKYSAVQVLAEGFDYSRFKNKLVLIAVDDLESTQYFQTLSSVETPSYLIRASVIENIINDNMIEKSHNAAITMLILFVIGGICAFVLPQVTMLYRELILLGSLVLLANFSYFMLTSFNVISETVFIGLELLLFMIASPLLDSSVLSTGKDAEKSHKSKLPRVEIEKPIFADAVEATKERKLVDSPSDPVNQATTAISTKTEAPSDHQSIDIDGVDVSGEAEKTGFVDHSAIDPDSETSMIDDSPMGDHDGKFEPEKKKKVEVSASHSIPTIANLTKLGRYEITGTLGKGAMGHVYAGIDPAINRPVALKTIRLDFISDPEEMEELKIRLFREAQAAGKLSHPNIVTIYDVGSDGDLQYIAMEHIEGQTLEDMIKKKTKFNYKIVAQIMIQICSALQYAHDRNIVHRDIKPANIMITKDYGVKVMDFGIARIDSNSMTKTGIAMGTPNYISPEQLQGQPVDAKTDLFSLGVVLYELLVGKRPFKGENITSLIYSVLNHEPLKPSNVVPQIPLLFDHIVDKTLKKDPQARYQNANEIINDLREFVEAFSRA